MFFIKLFILISIFLSSLQAGKIISKKYCNRVLELKDIKNALNMFLTKIRFTYESVPESFKEIGNSIDGNIGNLFIASSNLMADKQAGDAWEKTIDEVQTNLNDDDKNILKKMGRMLGKTDLEGQISEVKLVQEFINSQIDIAEEERKKNEKLYKTLGGIVGLALVIILA